MIAVENLAVRYGPASVLEGVTVRIEEGELCLVVGPTGSGKTTLLGAIAAHVPHLTGGTVAGRVLVAGRDTRGHLPRDLADVVGYVAQDPRSSFVTDTVEEELAFTMEQLGVSRGLMRRRVEDVLDLLGIEPLRDRALHTLSGGEAQRVAIGAVLTAQPRILVLDEPTSALDPVAAEDVLAALSRLVMDSGLTVVMSEHRLERVVQFADRVVALIPGPGGSMSAIEGGPADVLAASRVRPPVAELGALAGADPLPMTVREARRRLRGLRESLAGADAPAPSSTGEVTLEASGVVVTYGDQRALAGVDVQVRSGEILAVMGRNGAGKSSLLWVLAGALTPAKGRVRTDRRVALVPQSPEDLLFRLTVRAECEAADAAAGAPGGRAREVLEGISPGIDPEANPRDLSEGQRLALALAVQLTPAPDVLVLDEPTRGLDYAAKERLAHTLRRLRGRGVAAVVASHDVEFLALVADRVIQLASGEVVADGPARTLLTDSAFTAPQVARVLAPLPLLTVAEARAALEGAGDE